MKKNVKNPLFWTAIALVLLIAGFFEFGLINSNGQSAPAYGNGIAHFIAKWAGFYSTSTSSGNNGNNGGNNSNQNQLTCSAYFSPSQVLKGGAAKLNWNFSAAATSASYTCDGDLGSGDLSAGLSGFRTLNPNQSQTCVIFGQNSSGYGTCSASIQVSSGNLQEINP